MIIMSNERANERRLTFSSATRLTTVAATCGGDLCDILVRENGRIIKYLFFYLRPIAETRDAPTQRSRTRVSGMSQSLGNVVVVAHYLHNVIVLRAQMSTEAIK